MDTIGSVLKLMSNFSYLQISVNRFLLVGKEHPEWLIKSSKIKIKTFFLLSFLFSCLLSSIVYFQSRLFVYQTKESLLYYSTETSSLSYYMGGRVSYFYRAILAKTKQIPMLSTFILFHDLFSYFLFCVFSLVLDILTVNKLHYALKEKVKIKGKTERQKSRESERNSIMMVVLSSLTNFFFRAPELLSIIFYYVVLNDGGYVFKMMCYSYYDCQLFVEFSKVFYTLSICFNFVFYVKFNSVFRLSFAVMVNRLYYQRTSSTENLQ